MSGQRSFASSSHEDGAGSGSISSYLTGLSAGPIHFLPNPGNAGDSLIAHAAFEMFRSLGMEYSIVDRSGFDATGKTVVVGGGGGLITYYDLIGPFVRDHHATARKFVILPSTINGNTELLEELGANVDVICREEESFRHVRRHARRANVMLMDDMAFSLDVRRTLARKPPGVVRRLAGMTVDRLLGREPAPRLSPLLSLRTRRFLLRHAARTIGSAEWRGVLNCFRTDAERTDAPIPRHNVDASRVFAWGVGPEEIAHAASHGLLRFVDRYNCIRTNRLHVAIAGALLGKRVHFYPNSYYKCREVYQFSMKGRFPNVTWLG